jgi:2-polyprenyl-3-methyl-5-hydroxy-6-metoxy-1,4-benzoquinol methylase
MVPEEIRGSSAVLRVRRELERRRKLPAPADQRVVRTLPELDEVLHELDFAALESDDAFRRGFQTFRMEVDQQMPDDPFSDEYRQAVLDQYAWLHGTPYSVANEDLDFDTDAAVDTPFPYTTQSAATVGEHLMGIGHIIRRFELPPGSRVLELGAGWGNTTLTMAQMGYKVTAVDISPKFTNLIKARAGQINVHVETVAGDFSVIHELDGQFDALLFFESFHHCLDHVDLISGLDRVIAPDGRILFAAEPITNAFTVPWGLRFDGESLWAIRRHGWLELGFQRSYFDQVLGRYGWKVDRAKLNESIWGEIFLARRR